MNESAIHSTQLCVEDVINSLPDCWKNNPRIMNPSQAKLNNDSVYMIVDISSESIMFMVFICEKDINLSESIELSKNSFYRYGSSEVIKKMTPLVDEWNKLATENKDKESVAKNVFTGIISMAKECGIAIIPSMTTNSFRFKNSGNKHYGEVAESIEGNYRLVLNKLSDQEVKSIIALITVGELNQD